MNDASRPLVASFDRTGTGLDYLRRILAGEYAWVPIGEHLGFHLREVEKGRVVITGKPGPRSFNLLSSVHGGWTAAVLDTAMALSCLSTLSEEQSFTTLDIRINYLRPITAATGEVRAEGSVIQSGRKIAYCEARLTDPAGKLLAHGTGSLLMLPRAPASA
jgi:uncharacterized protein (TIGR00369 family)